MKKKKKPQKRMCIEHDESGHDYVIPVRLKDDFERWSLLLDDSDPEWSRLSDVFEPMRLNMHISNHSFIDFREISD
jgi:hypothetical protein